MIGCLPTQALAFLAVFVYATHATHATQAIAFEWKPGLRRCVHCFVVNGHYALVEQRSMPCMHVAYSRTLWQFTFLYIIIRVPLGSGHASTLLSHRLLVDTPPPVLRKHPNSGYSHTAICITAFTGRLKMRDVKKPHQNAGVENADNVVYWQ